MDEPFHARAIVSTSPARPMRSGAITSKAVPRRSPVRPLVFYLYSGVLRRRRSAFGGAHECTPPAQFSRIGIGIWRRQIP